MSAHMIQRGAPGVVETRARSVALDVFRGLAILAMIVDHVMVVAGGPILFRIMPGRLAMPMFFLLAGHLARSPRWRHAGIAGIGIALPFAVPWIDAPNVLVLWALGVVVLWACRRYGFPVWLLPVIGLAFSANSWSFAAPGAYEPVALLGLMAIGSAVPYHAFVRFGRGVRGRARKACALLGRHPVSIYVGHLLVLQAIVQAVG